MDNTKNTVVKTARARGERWAEPSLPYEGRAYTLVAHILRIPMIFPDWEASVRVTQLLYYFT